MAEKRVNTFGTFLKTIQESPRIEPQQQRSASSAVPNAVEIVLKIVGKHPEGIEARALLEESSLSVVEFGQVVDRLCRIGALQLQTDKGRESVSLGSKADELLSLIR